MKYILALAMIVLFSSCVTPDLAPVISGLQDLQRDLEDVSGAVTEEELDDAIGRSIDTTKEVIRDAIDSSKEAAGDTVSIWEDVGSGAAKGSIPAILLTLWLNHHRNGTRRREMEEIVKREQGVS